MPSTSHGREPVTHDLLRNELYNRAVVRSGLAKTLAPALAIGTLVLALSFVRPARLSAQSRQSKIQLSGAVLPSFDVASIKASTVPRNMSATVYPGGKIDFQNLSLKTLIQFAFNVSTWQISGGEDWTGETNFDVVAEPPEETQTPYKLGHWWFGFEDERLRQMLQTLLTNRFHLKFHMETKSGTVYLLERSDKRLKLVPTKLPDPGKVASGNECVACIGRVGSTAWTIFDSTSQQIANFASNDVLNHPVLDKTGLDGHFDFRYEVVLTDPAAATSDDSTFLEAINAMGLKLDKTTGPVETFVIDHAEKPSPD